MFKEFYLKDVFGSEPIRGSRLVKEKRVSGNIPLVTAGEQNEGIAEYISNTENQTLQNMLTIDMFGNCFYRDYPYKSDDNILSFGLDGKSTEEMLYVASIINSTVKKQYSYGKQYRKGSYLETVILLPVIENSNPDHEYTAQDIDWQYMRDRITELERDRITELDAYLQATGLNDYELTEDDKKILSLSAKRASDEDGTLEDNSEDEVRFGEFKIETLFHKVDLKRLKKTFEKDKDLSREQTSEYSLPLINAKNGDNGIMYYGRPEDWESDTYCIDIVNDGAISTGNVYPQPQRTGVLYNAYMVKPNAIIESAEVLMYLAKSIEKIIKEQYGYDNKATWDKVKQNTIYLPITSDRTPDFDYMERYIRAMEKVVIADVVKYKDKVIEETRKVVGA